MATVAALVAATALLAGGCASNLTEPTATPFGATPDIESAADAFRDGSPSTIQMAPETLPDLIERVMGSVVLIEGVTRGGPVSGTGVVIDGDGHILTNYHVIEGQTELKVTLENGSASLAEVVGTDPGNDLAVIRATGFSGEELRPATLGDSDGVRVGETVFAIGNPFTQKFSVSSGIISATDRSSETFGGRSIQGVLQTDAALNPGNSGGPLFNLDGDVIGINTSIENPYSRSFAGLGFAVPANTAKRFLPQMLAGETVGHAQLGIANPLRLDEVEAGRLGISVERGLYLQRIVAGGAAERAGLQVGDVLVELNGHAVHTFEDLARAIDSAEVGAEVSLVVWRNGDEIDLTAALQPWDLVGG
ncbi:MAG: trypsin-like peptidase domain-containing protein [Dehalococcoidia bacterium]